MTQTVSRVFGVVFLLVGLLGLVSTPFSMSGGLLLGLFPVNVLHNLVHLAFGACPSSRLPLKKLELADLLKASDPSSPMKDPPLRR